MPLPDDHQERLQPGPDHSDAHGGAGPTVGAVEDRDDIGGQDSELLGRGDLAASRPGITQVDDVEPVPATAEHGRGLKIIDALTDNLQLTGDGRAGTTVHFEKVLSWIPGAAGEHLFSAHA